MANSKMYDNLLTVLQPHMKLLSDIGGSQSTAANVDFTKAGTGYDEALNYFRSILGGDRTNLLKNLDATAITRSYDEQARQNYELAPRGGRRAATAANLDFSKMSELNKLLQYLRGQAPGQIANIAQALTGQGSARLGSAINSMNAVTGLRTGIENANEQLQQQAADRKAALIGSIFEAAGSVAGAWLGCNTLDTWILLPNNNYKQLKDIEIGDKICSLIDERLEESVVIRKDIIEKQEIHELTCNDTSLKGTLSHVVAAMNDVEVTFEDVALHPMSLPMVGDNGLAITVMNGFKPLNRIEDVAILKLNNEHHNYNYITNGLISIDADCRT